MLDGITQQVPWGWYLVRSSGLVAFLLLYLSILLGLIIRIPYLRRFIAGRISLELHCWLALLAWLLALTHGIGLLFDTYLNFSFADIFIPLAAKYETGFISLGIAGFYLILLLVVTSYAKKVISQSLWRAVHLLNIGMYFIISVHALYLGADMKISLVHNVFWAMQGLLALIIILHIIARIRCHARKTQECEI